MKKRLAALLVMSSAAAASAAPIYSDAFDYTSGTPLGSNGTLVGNGAWAASTNNTTTPTVTTGSLSYPGLGSSGNSVALQPTGGAAARIGTGTITSGTIYYSFVAKISSLTDTEAGVSQTGGAFLAGFDSNTSGTSFTTGAALYVRRNADDPTKYDLGINTTGASNKEFSNGYTADQNVFIVGSMTFGDLSHLDVFADPASVPGTEPTTHSADSAGVDSVASSISAFYFRDNAGEPPIQVDELHIGTTWADVVPEPGSLSLAALGAVTVLARRRRRL
jgi:hypothetical protein